MNTQTELEIEGGLTLQEVRLLAAGIRQASGPWPPVEFEPIMSRFYRVPRLWWPIRRYLRRLL